MKRYFFQLQSFVLFIFSLVFTSCNGQVKTEIPRDINTKKEQLKISKPKDINKEASIGFGIQDKAGNIWFGSYGEGVYKYNGKSFIQYTMKDGLNSNTTYSMVEDKKGSIWVGTNKGLNRFDGNKFENIPIQLINKKAAFPNFLNNNSPTMDNKVWSMMVDKAGTIWFGTDDGIFCYNGIEFTRFLDNQAIINKDSLELKAIFSILETNDGKIWFTACQNEGISRFDGKTLSNSIPYKEVRRTDKVIEDKNGNLWFACVFKGVGRLDGKSFTQNVFNEKATNGPSNIIEDANGNLWFDTQDGLGCYNGKTLKIFNNKDTIPTKKLVPVLSDKTGHLWLSSKGMGLYQYNQGKFTSFSE